MAFRGAFVHKTQSALQAIPSSYYTGAHHKVVLDVVVYDTDALFDNSANEFVVPAGVSKVRLSGQVVFAHGNVGMRQVLITKNDALFDGYAASNAAPTSGTTPDYPVITPVLPVVEGDRFQLTVSQFQTSAGESLNIHGGTSPTGTWFSIEIIE